MRIYDIILKKRNRQALDSEEISFFVEGYTRGEIHDYQASALMMAIFLNGMNEQETIELTKAMMNSGDIVDLNAIQGVKVDKHSTGGVGDTTTLVLAPLLAATGVKVAKMSGRGLGHTGGTIDKLESINGFSTSLTIDEFVKTVQNVHVAVIGQTKNIAPADKKLYALRDVTATVDNISLIASSIMSKKLAAGADAIVLDVKVGSGAFLKTLEEAIEVATLMVKIGEGMGRSTMAVISEMSQPLGNAIGNAIEVIEAVDVLKGEGPEDLRELCLTLGASLIHMADSQYSLEDAREQLTSNLESGKGLQAFKDFVSAQGGDISFVEDYSRLPVSEIIHEVYPEHSGFIHAIESDEVGIASMILGAGRENLEDEIDHAAGIYMLKKIGDPVNSDEPIAIFYTNRENRLVEAEKRFLKALTISQQPKHKEPLIKAVISKDGVSKFI